MAAHARFSPSGAHRWMECHGSLAMEMGCPNPSTEYAMEGTAAHTLLAMCLDNGTDAANYLGNVLKVRLQDDDGNPVEEWREFTVDEEMAEYVQTTVDDVRRDVAAGWTLLVEQRVEFTQAIGTGDGDGERQFGTADIILLSPCGTIIKVRDFKYGAGVQVFASELTVYDDQEPFRRGNRQMLSYALGAIETLEGVISERFEKVILVVDQPRMDWVDEFECDRADVIAHGEEMRKAAKIAKACIKQREAGKEISIGFLNPGTKQCRWCKAKADCPALERTVAETVMGEFDIVAEAEPKAPTVDRLGVAYSKISLIQEWCAAVTARINALVQNGETVIGVDGEPMKMIAGRKGDRYWVNPELVEGTLVGLLPPEKVYKPRKIISPAEAEKILKKKKTMSTWLLLADLYSQAPGQPRLALGSDPAPAYKPADVAAEFDIIDAEDPTL